MTGNLKHELLISGIFHGVLSETKENNGGKGNNCSLGKKEDQAASWIMVRKREGSTSIVGCSWGK
jgi:hypothetical protein